MHLVELVKLTYYTNLSWKMIILRRPKCDITTFFLLLFLWGVLFFDMLVKLLILKDVRWFKKKKNYGTKKVEL